MFNITVLCSIPCVRAQGFSDTFTRVCAACYQRHRTHLRAFSHKIRLPTQRNTPGTGWHRCNIKLSLGKNDIKIRLKLSGRQQLCCVPDKDGLLSAALPYSSLILRNKQHRATVILYTHETEPKSFLQWIGTSSPVGCANNKPCV